jgi:hypothetical protein
MAGMKLRFSIRELILVTVIVALAVGWWVDHTHPRFRPWGLVNPFSGTTEQMIDSENGELWEKKGTVHEPWDDRGGK